MNIALTSLIPAAIEIVGILFVGFQLTLGSWSPARADRLCADRQDPRHRDADKLGIKKV